MSDLNEAAARRADNYKAYRMELIGHKFRSAFSISAAIQDRQQRDDAILADAMLARLEADERERIERAKPADIEWLTTIPGSTWFPEVGLWSLRIGLVTIDHSHGGGWWTLERAQIWAGQDATRGMVTDMLRAFAGAPKGGVE